MIDVLPQPDWQSDDGSVVLYCADCLTILPQLPEGSVDAVVTDPPYGIAVGSAFVRSAGTRVDDGNEPMNVGDTWGWAKYANCIRPGGNVAAFHKRGDSLPDPFIPWHRYYIVKTSSPPTPRPVFVSMVEECSIGQMPGATRRWFGSGWTPNRWIGNTPARLRRGHGHAAEKPLEPICVLCSALADYGDTILDPFMGSGTTGVACVKTGRKFIGIEMERKYFDIAVKRIQDAFAEQVLFATETAQ